jgi:hypothetical protein
MVSGGPSWQTSPISDGPRKLFVAKSGPDFEAQYLKNIRTRADLFAAQYHKKGRTCGSPLFACAIPQKEVHLWFTPFLDAPFRLSQPPRVVRCAHTSQASGPLLWAASPSSQEIRFGKVPITRYAAGCGRRGRPGALRLGECPCGQC